MVNYSNSKIYKICSFQTDLIYIGSTTQPLSKRLVKHRDDYKNNRGTTSKEILQYPDAQIILLESVNCENKDELHAIERRYIENNNCCNKNIPTRTQKEWNIDNKEKIKEYQKEYQKEYTKEYYEKNKDALKKHDKKYYEKNKDQIRERHKKYSEINKEQRLKNQKQYDKFRRSDIGEFIRSFNFKCSCEV